MSKREQLHDDSSPEHQTVIFIAKHWLTIWRGIIAILLVGVAFGQIKADYVTKKDLVAAVAPFAEQAKSNAVHISAMETTIAVMAEQNKRNDRQDELIKDLEMRLRSVEKLPR